MKKFLFYFYSEKLKLGKMTFVFSEIIMNLIKKMNGEGISFNYEGGKYFDYVVDKIGGYSIVHEINDFVRCLSEFKNIDDCVYDKLFCTLN